MELDLRDLRYFETIARLQHLGKAAEQLHRSQPALTNCLRRLESACEVPLFERSGRGMRLTPAGEALMRWARRVRVDTQEAQREVREIGHGISGRLRIGLVPTAARYLLPHATLQLWGETPEVTLSTVVGLTNTLAPLLMTGELDFIVASEAQVTEGVESELLGVDHYVVAASPDHELHQRQATIQDFARCRWVLDEPGSPTREWLEHTFDRYRLPLPRVQVETSAVVMLTSLINKSGLLTFVSREYLHETGTLKEILVPETTMPRRLVALYRKNQTLAPAAQRMVALLKFDGLPGALL